VLTRPARWRRFSSLVAVYVAGLISGAAISVGAVSVTYPFERLEVFAEALSIIHSRYVDERDADQLVYDAIGGLTQGLDDHSIFMGPDEYREMKEQTSGQYFGIGIAVEPRQGRLFVLRLIEGSPAKEVGILVGDEILAVDGKTLVELGPDVALARITGRRGSQVVLLFSREGLAGSIEFAVLRDQVRTSSVESAWLGDGIAWLRVERFQRRTVDEVRRELRGLATNEVPLRGLVVDLRNNPGGYLSQAVAVADLWLADGSIVSTIDRTEGTQRDMAREPGSDRVTQLVVLIDGRTASAAEIVAGALQDRGRAQVIGSTSYGKGSVQQFFDLSDGSALKLTTARYYTPSGESIQGAGVRPDIALDGELSAEARSSLDALLLHGAGDPRWVKEDTPLQLGVLALRDAEAVARWWAAQESEEVLPEESISVPPSEDVAGVGQGG
jgi:carboxyl-terminal processing protease